MENYVYPLIVCEEEGKIVFFNGAAQAAFGEEDLLGRPLPQSWMGSDMVEIDTADTGITPFRLIWEEIMWDGNVAWYLVAVPATGGADPRPDPEAAAEAESLRKRLEESQELAANEAAELRARLEKSQELATVEVEQLRAQLSQTELEAIAEIDELRSQLEKSQEITALEVDELKARLASKSGDAEDAQALRLQLEQSAEMVAVESEKRQVAEGDRAKLEAKLRDLHQRSLNKLEAARNALESERAERNQLSERLNKLKGETDNLRRQLEEKTYEVDEIRHRSGEHFEKIKAELLEKSSVLQSQEEELSVRNKQLIAAEQKAAGLSAELEAKAQEVSAAEERAERYRKEYEELDREMIHSQEQNALLTAKLQSMESRMERYQRLMDRDSNEFSRGGDSELELEKLRGRIEELEVELAATNASMAGSHQGEGAANLASLEEQCRSLQSELQEREARILSLEQSVGSSGPSQNGAGGELEQKLQQSQSLIEELRFHRELEYQEAQASLRALQERYAALRVDGEDAGAVELESLQQQLSQTQRELQQTSDLLANTKQELDIKAEIAQSVPLLRERVHILESKIEELSSAPPASQGHDPQLLARLRELEFEVDRARQEASPEELQLARRHIAELEAALASRPQAGMGEGELSQRNQQLESELVKVRGQLAEMNQELRRTLEGDRETKKLAYADQLTGLPNLNLTGQYLQVCFERSGRAEGALALILIDLDHFRRVNDALGQKAGDELLKQVGARLQRSVTEKDTAIARRGEDEFMVVAFMEGARVDGEALMARVRGIAHNLLNELAKPFEILDQKVQVTASLGVALYPGPAQSRVELLEHSEHAMYKAKETGRARVSFYSEDMHNHRERRKYLETEMRQAVNQGQFGLVYQPIYELASSKVVGIEALLRWNHPQRGVLEPSEFLDAAEDTGIIVQIGEQIIQEALGVAKQKFMKRRFLSLNLSFRQLIDSGFSARFMKHLQMAGVPPHEVIVEISEKSASIDPERVKNTLAHLAHWGVGIALDDFGTGSSELSHLTEFALRVLKIDGRLIAKLPDDRGATKLCQAITKMSTALEIPVLAEGVETREQLTLVASIGCQYAQGYILNSPMNVSQLIQVL